MNRIELEPQHASEIATETFDFTSRLAASETLSTATVTSAVYSGATSADLAFYGAATISGQKVTQRVGGGTAGTIYLLTCTVVTSTGQTLMLGAYLPILPAGA